MLSARSIIRKVKSEYKIEKNALHQLTNNYYPSDLSLPIQDNLSAYPAYFAESFITPSAPYLPISPRGCLDRVRRDCGVRYRQHLCMIELHR